MLNINGGSNKPVQVLGKYSLFIFLDAFNSMNFFLWKKSKEKQYCLEMLYPTTPQRPIL